jgi:hypothetical protein
MTKLDVQGVTETQMKSSAIVQSKSSDFLIESDSNDNDLEIQIKKDAYHSTNRDTSIVVTNIQSNTMNFITSQWIEITSMVKEQRFWDECYRFAYAGFALFAMVTIMTIVQMFSDRWYEEHAFQIIDNRYVYATDPLYDRVLISLPNWGNQRFILILKY